MNNKVAAKIGSEEFLDPEILTSPLILLGPSIENLSINYFLIFATWIVVCPWYLPFLDLYVVSGWVSDLKNKNWAIPSLEYIFAGLGVVLLSSITIFPSNSFSIGVTLQIIPVRA